MSKAHDRDKNRWQKAFPPPSLSYRERVDATLASLPAEKKETEADTMKLRKRFAVPVVSLLAVMLLGTGLMATGTLESWFASSDNRPTYTELPDTAQLAENPGFVPTLVGEFANGYRFDSAVVGDQEGRDGEGNALIAQKFISATYVKGKEEVTLNANPATALAADDAAVVATVNGADLRYTAYLNKFVPPDYEMTAADKAAEASGDLVFSYGAAEVSVEKIQHVTWEKDDIAYDLMAMDSPLDQADLVAMARQLLGAE